MEMSKQDHELQEPSSRVGEVTAAITNERQMSLKDTFRFWPKAIVYSFIISLAVIMEGYDTNLMSNFYAFPAFKNHFGNEVDPDDGGMLISSRWQAIISNGAHAGSIIGLAINGWVSEWAGYKKTMIVSMISMIGAVFIPFFSTGLPMFLAGAIIQGIPWGIFQTLAVTYAADVCPLTLRGYMTSWINICWVIGQLISSGVLNGFLRRTDQWGYRIPFAVQWIWPIPIIIGTLAAPESPWWLIRKNRIDDAKAAIQKLTRPESGVHFDLEAHIEMMHLTNRFEMEAISGTSYRDCFRGTNLRRTEIAAMVWVTQALCGVPFMGYGVQFMIQAGLNTNDSYAMNLGQTAVGLVGCLIAWYIMTYVGRRMIYLSGLLAMFIILMAVGFLGIPAGSIGLSWAVGSLIVTLLFVFQLSIGPVCYTLVAEVPSTRLRIKTVAIARAFYNAAGLVTNVVMPKMVGKNDWNWGAKGGFFWAALDFLFLIWTFFRLPEPMGLSYSELDLLFENKVGARHFSQEAADLLKPELGKVALRTKAAEGLPSTTI